MCKCACVWCVCVCVCARCACLWLAAAAAVAPGRARQVSLNGLRVNDSGLCLRCVCCPFVMPLAPWHAPFLAGPLALLASAALMFSHFIAAFLLFVLCFVLCFQRAFCFGFGFAFGSTLDSLTPYEVTGLYNNCRWAAAEAEECQTARGREREWERGCLLGIICIFLAPFKARHCKWPLENALRELSHRRTGFFST